MCVHSSCFFLSPSTPLYLKSLSSTPPPYLPPPTPLPPRLLSPDRVTHGCQISSYYFTSYLRQPRWPGGKGVHLESGRSRVRIPLALGFFRGRVIPGITKKALQWLPCPTPGVIGSVLGLVGPVSVYCDWVRWKLWSATSISMWQICKIVCADPFLRCTCMLLGR